MPLELSMTALLKTDTVRARIEANVKRDAEAILRRLGVSHSAFINMGYHAVVANGGIPFSLSVPNAETREAIAEGRARKGVTVHKSADSFRKSLLAR
jgi:DNA-damage-inducible protein J